MAKYITCHRRGTAEDWAKLSTLIPLEGEIVIEIDEVNSLHKLKIGDGKHTYAELAYLKAGDEVVTQVLTEVKPRIVTVELAETWNQDAEGKYSQVLTLDNITSHSRLDLQPSVDMIAEFKQLGVVFVTENNSGVITVYSVGNMPDKAYTMQATIVETECDGDNTIVGIPVGAPATVQEETDPTVPAWAKASTKPSYTKSEVGLGNVDNVKQYSASNPPPYPVTKVNNKTGNVALSASDVGADASGTASSAVSAHNTSTSAHADIREEISQLSSEIADKEQLKPEFAQTIEGCTDTSKLYVLPDGYIYAYIKTKIWQEGSTNLIPTSTVSGGGSIYDGDGYKLGVRLNSSATEKEQLWCITTGFIPITKNDVLRIKYWANGKSDYFTQTGNSICLYNSSYTHLTTNQEGTGLVLSQNGIGEFDSFTEIYTVKISDILDNDSIAFVRISTLVTTVGQTATDADATKVIATVNEEIADGYYVESYGWASTGHAFVPTDYEDRIIELEDGLEAQEARLTSLEINGGNNVPTYWLEELATKANAIQVAMEKAGRNKSAFLWYTDAHWANGNSKVSPSLLNYLYMNTPINKVNFGGDIIGDSLLATREEMKYLYEWRKAIKDLPNHHSVLGNHDIFASDSVDYEGDNFTYSWLIAPEESADMVMGGDFYYYIDNPCEKTRYLYLDSGKRSLSDDEVAFVIDALTTAPNGWHIAAISHIWWLYESSSTPTEGGIAGYCRQILNVFDAYNARQSGSVTMQSVAHSYNFSSCGAKVEFCIGGHIHVDYDITSTGGIPIILTTSDTNQNRVPDSTVDSGTLGTITESAVYGIVADYDNSKITVVGVGRGTSREISY